MNSKPSTSSIGYQNGGLSRKELSEMTRSNCFLLRKFLLDNLKRGIKFIKEDHTIDVQTKEKRKNLCYRIR